MGLFWQRTVLPFVNHAVTAIFEISWIPDTVMHVLQDFGLYRIRSVAFDITHTILAFNSAVNPFCLCSDKPKIQGEDEKNAMQSFMCKWRKCQCRWSSINHIPADSSIHIHSLQRRVLFSSNATDQRHLTNTSLWTWLGRYAHALLKPLMLYWLHCPNNFTQDCSNNQRLGGAWDSDLYYNVTVAVVGLIDWVSL